MSTLRPALNPPALGRCSGGPGGYAPGMATPFDLPEQVAVGTQSMVSSGLVRIIDSVEQLTVLVHEGEWRATLQVLGGTPIADRPVRAAAVHDDRLDLALDGGQLLHFYYAQPHAIDIAQVRAALTA